MADVSKAIEVIFSGSDDGLSTTIADIGGNLNNLTGNLQSITDPLADMGKKVLALEAALGVLALGGLALAVTKSGEFGDSFNEISTLINAPAEQLDQFRGNIIEYAQDSTQSFEAINGAVYQAISATGDWENSLSLLGVAEQLAVGGVTDLETATSVLATTLNAYGDGAAQAADYSDVFFTIVKDGVTTVPQLAGSISQVTGIAASAKIPFDELGAAVAAMTGYTGRTEQSMTMLKAAIAAIIAPTEATREAASALGIDIGQAAIDSQGFPAVLADIYDKTGGSLEKIKQLIPSVEGANAVLLLGGDAGGKFATALADMETRAGATTAAYEKMAENFGLINQQMANNLNSILILLGDEIQGAYADVAGGVIDVLQALATEVEGGTFDPILDKVKDLAAQLTDILKQTAANLPAAFDQVDFGNLLDSFDELLAAGQGLFQGFFGDVDLTTPEGLAAAIQKIVDSIESLTSVTTGIVSGLTPFVEWAGQMIDAFNELDPATKEVFGQIMGFAIGITPVLGAFGALGLAIEGGALAVGGLSRVIGFKGGTGLTGAMGGLMEVMGPVLALWATWEASFAAGTALYENNTLGIRDMADSVANWVGNLITGIDTEKGLNDVLTAGTNLTQEQIDAWRERTKALQETPEVVETKFGITVSQGQEIFDFIIANADAGLTGTEILTRLKAEYADSPSAELINWAQVEEEIKKWVDMEVQDPAGTKAAVQGAVGADSDGIVSFPAQFHVDTTKLLTDTEQAALAAAAEWAKVGLDFRIDGLDSALQKVKDATNEMATASKVSFDGVGGHMEAVFNKATGVWEANWEAIQGTIPGTISEPVKTEIDDVYKAALEKKETIEAALKFRAEVDVKQFEEETKQLKIKADLLQEALKLKAEIDIKNLENVGKTIDAISLGLETSAKIISDALGSLGDIGKQFGNLSPQLKAATQAIESETENRKKLTDSLVEINEAQAEYLKAKTQALQKQDALIQITADGLEPEIEAFMWKILEKIQVRATENMDEFLLGL